MRTSVTIPAVLALLLAARPLFTGLTAAGSGHVIAGLPWPAVAPVGASFSEGTFRTDRFAVATLEARSAVTCAVDLGTGGSVLATTVGLGSDGDRNQGFQLGLSRKASFRKQPLKGCDHTVTARRIRAPALSSDVVTAPSIGTPASQLAVGPVEPVGAPALAETAHPSGPAGAGSTHGVAHRVRLTLAAPAAVASVLALGAGHGAVRPVPTGRAGALARDSIALGVVGAATLLGTVGTESSRNTSVFAEYSSVPSGAAAFPSFLVAGASISAVASLWFCTAFAPAGNFAAFSGPLAVSSCRGVALSRDGIAAGAVVAFVGTQGAPGSLRAAVLALGAREARSAHALSAHGVAPHGVGTVALAHPGAARSVREGRAREVAESAVAGGRTLAISETSMTAAARAVVGTQAIALFTETSERAHVVTTMLAVCVRCATASACLVIAHGGGVAEALLFAVGTEHTLGTLCVAKFSDVSRLTATHLGGRIARSVFAGTT